MDIQTVISFFLFSYGSPGNGITAGLNTSGIVDYFQHECKSQDSM